MYGVRIAILEQSLHGTTIVLWFLYSKTCLFLMGLDNTSYLCIFLRMYHSSFHTGIFCESNMFCSVTFYSAWCYFHYYCVIPFFLIMETPTDFLLKKEEEIHNPHRWWRVKNCKSKYRVTQIYSLQGSQGALIYVTIIRCCCFFY